MLVAISFEPYAQETLAVVASSALAQDARPLAITDSQLSPLAGRASAVLLAQAGTTFGFCSLASTLYLTQSLLLGQAYRMELGYEHRGTLTRDESLILRARFVRQGTTALRSQLSKVALEF